MAIFFTADTHFFHYNIIKYCQRPFIDEFQMNEVIKNIWNNQVKKGDLVYHLGDVSFGGIAETFRLLAELNGEIILILGNHDKIIKENDIFLERFKNITDYLEIEINKKFVVLSHYPMLQWNYAQRGSYHLYGHTHGSVKIKGKAFDVGIDNHPEFKLWSWEELRAILKQRKVIDYPVKPEYPLRKVNNLGFIELIKEEE